jgi:hypothetical protein
MYDEKSFYSIDRLVEFGMGMTIAQQMVKTMNQTIDTMRIPGSGNTMLQPAQTPLVYYAVLDGKQAGPFSETEIARLINDKKISRETYIWHPGLREWRITENVPEIVKLVALMPPPVNIPEGTIP